MNATGQTYEIRELADFASVPADRRDAMLADFKQFIELLDAQRPVIDLAKAIGGNVGITFKWIDDGDVGCKSAFVTMKFGEA
jgi:hypothetical protein